ncbi:MBL fold metallo-hydrolase [Candidatus Pacearchaeota archaeon]|nr:MBL fold metallo-hydrolase [Candidatus Pacearchaeota archaeon]
MLYYQGYGGVDGVVTGSKHLFSLNGEKILHDCGSLMDGKPREHNEGLPFKVDFSAVVFSHGHYDHMGDAYKLFLDGYQGNYFCHEATEELLRIDLEDAVNSEYYRTQRYNREIKGKKDSSGKFIPFKKPRFKFQDVKEIMKSVQGLKYGVTVQISDSVKATFYDAGHIIGSSQVLYEVNDKNKIRILTCFDLGRNDIDAPIILPPFTKFKDIDYCFIESTYGNRSHKKREESKQELEEVLLEGIKGNRRMLIGAFSIMRTHQILSDLYWVYKKGSLPQNFKIYLDSPSALKVDSIITKHPECMDEQARKDFSSRSENPFKFPNLKIVRSKLESENLNNLAGPYAIISASGMWSMGRIVRHLESHIEDSNSLLVQTGYQVPGCIGYLLEQGKEKHPVIKIEGKEYQYNAGQHRIRGYGAHADGESCVKHVSEYVKPRKKVFIVHGEKEQSEWTMQQLKAKGLDAEIVRKDVVYELT